MTSGGNSATIKEYSISRNERVANMQIKRIVTSQRGTWIWQDAFRVAIYEPGFLKSGKLVWKSIYNSQKYSRPQLRKLGWGPGSKHGSMHNVPLTYDEISQYYEEMAKI